MVYCPEKEQFTSRVLCLELPYTYVCGECPRFPHRLKLLKNIGTLAVRCPVGQTLQGPTAQIDAKIRREQGYESVTGEICRLIRPFFHCTSCPNSSR